MPAEFTYVDALSELYRDPSATAMGGGGGGGGPSRASAYDVAYRAALEVARRGELVITIPDQFCIEGEFDFLILF